MKFLNFSFQDENWGTDVDKITLHCLNKNLVSLKSENVKRQKIKFLYLKSLTDWAWAHQIDLQSDAWAHSVCVDARLMGF